MSNHGFGALSVQVLEEFVEAGNRLPRTMPWQWLESETYIAGGWLGARELPISDLAREAEQARRRLAEARTAPLPVRRPSRGRPRLKLVPGAVLRALEEAGGNRRRAAQALGVSPPTLYRHIKGLELPRSRLPALPIPAPSTHARASKHRDCGCATCRRRAHRVSGSNHIRIARSLIRFFHAVSQ